MLEDMVDYAILIAVAIAIVLLITGKFIDLSVDRQTSVQSRATINLLQDIVTDSDFLMKDSAGNNMKLMVDQSKLGGSDPTKCCDSVQYDYKFAVGNSKPLSTSPATYLVTPTKDAGGGGIVKTNYVGPGSYDLGSFCYTGFGVGNKFGAEVPINVCKDGDVTQCTQAVAHLETTDSPLSEMSYWLTQICSFTSDSSKRITLSEKDYTKGDDLTIEQDGGGNRVCMGSGAGKTCKSFECKVTVSSNIALSTLANQDVPNFPLPEKCNFVKIVRKDGKVSVIEPFLDSQAQPKTGLFFLPADQDAWTEKFTDHILALCPSSIASCVTGDYPIGSKVGDVTAAKGDSYIALSASPNAKGNTNDIKMNLQMSDVLNKLDPKDPIDSCKTDNGETVPCVDMNSADRPLDKISFQGRILSKSGKQIGGYFTWKLYDINSKCIQVGHTVLGIGKDDVSSDAWKQFTIDKASAESTYKSCALSIFQLPTDYPKDFNWKIANVEFDACERDVAGITCLNAISDLNSLMVDNFYFQGTIKQEAANAKQ